MAKTQDGKIYHPPPPLSKSYFKNWPLPTQGSGNLKCFFVLWSPMPKLKKKKKKKKKLIDYKKKK